MNENTPAPTTFPSWFERAVKAQDLDEVVDLTGPEPERRFEERRAQPPMVEAPVPSAIVEYVTHSRVPTSITADAVAARRRNLLGLYVDRKA